METSDLAKRDEWLRL